jgi:hypothetical protein
VGITIFCVGNIDGKEGVKVFIGVGITIFCVAVKKGIEVWIDIGVTLGIHDEKRKMASSVEIIIFVLMAYILQGIAQRFALTHPAAWTWRSRPARNRSGSILLHALFGGGYG